jgi:large subunit ribosomal protein L28
LRRGWDFFRPHSRKCAENVKIILQSVMVSAIMRKLFSQILEKEVLQPMAKCQFCDKGVSFGIQVSHSHRRSNRTWKPNVKRVKAIVDGKPQRVYACTRCLRSGKVTRAV